MKVKKNKKLNQLIKNHLQKKLIQEFSNNKFYFKVN
jgi:hypothetical protein